MSLLSKFVSLHPYFKVHPGKLDAIKAMLPQFTARTATEKAMLLYEFSWNGDELFCREGYTDARSSRTSGQRWRAARGTAHHGRSHSSRSTWTVNRAGEVERAPRQPQSGVVRDCVKLRHGVDPAPKAQFPNSLGRRPRTMIASYVSAESATQRVEMNRAFS